MPLFITEGTEVIEEIKSMPGIYRYSLDTLMAHIDEIVNLEIPAIALFPKIDASLKNSLGSLAVDPDNLILTTKSSVTSINSTLPPSASICCLMGAINCFILSDNST